MTEPAPRVHWLRGNKGERTPRRLIVLDTESRIIETEPREVQGLRCWVAWQIIRPEPPAPWQVLSKARGQLRIEIAPAVEAMTKAKESWRLFTHNLSYDLGLTRLPLALLGRGWQLGKHNLASEQPWAYLKYKSRGLWLCDSWSWLPQPLERLGEIVGLPKPKLPDQDDALDAWMSRCEADVQITATALCRLLDEWDSRRLGWWSITGPASGWNTMLHFPARSKIPTGDAHATQSTDPHKHRQGERVLVVPDSIARSFERTALYSGRRDVWRVGDLGKGPWAEIDLKAAHLTICANLPLPYRRWADFQRLDLDDWRLDTPGAGIQAECVVRPRSPRYPLRVKGAVLHPVGTFATPLAGPEILDARARGELVSIGHGYGYHLGHTMRDWAQWGLAVLADDGSEVDPLLQVAVKAWSRSVPGRWGMTHSRDVKKGPSHVEDWSLEPITIGNPPRRGTLFHLAGTWTESIADQESDDSFPAILAYVQSYTRLALNRMLDALPAGMVASCNTEGAWVSGRCLVGSEAHQLSGSAGDSCRTLWRPVLPADLSLATFPLTVQLKQTAERLHVLSPQHIKADGLRLYSGVPRTAQQVGAETYTFQTWPKLRGQIERGDPRGYVREQRTVNLASVPVSRWSYQDGHCEPVEVAWSPETGNVICPPNASLAARHGPLRAVQHPALRRVLARS